MTQYPRAQISPISPTGQFSRIGIDDLEFRMRKSTPTVETRRSTGSLVVVIVTPGDVSVCPYTITISLICIFVLTCFITSIGQGDPAMIPVRKVFRLYFSKFGMRKFSDEHRWYTVKSCTPFLLNSFQDFFRIECRSRQHHR